MKTRQIGIYACKFFGLMATSWLKRVGIPHKYVGKFSILLEFLLPFAITIGSCTVALGSFGFSSEASLVDCEFVSLLATFLLILLILLFAN